MKGRAQPREKVIVLSPKDRRRSKLAAEIERVALLLFLEHGFSAVTVDQIADAADIANRTFFRYFASKEDLLLGDGPRIAVYLPPEFRTGVADAVGSMMPAVSGVSILPTAFLTGRVLRYFDGVQRSDEIPPMRIWERPSAASVETTNTILPGLR